jgi:hypothetical protein
VSGLWGGGGSVVEYLPTGENVWGGATLGGNIF